MKKFVLIALIASSNCLLMLSILPRLSCAIQFGEDSCSSLFGCEDITKESDSTTWSPEMFADGDYTNDPTWTPVGVSNASWGVESGRAKLTRSGVSAAGALWAEAPEFGGGVGLTFKPTNYETDPTYGHVYLKVCESEPTIVAQENGCYTAKFYVVADGSLMPEFGGSCSGLYTSMQVYRDETRIAYACGGISTFTDHTLTLSVSDGTVSAAYDTESITASASDATYTAFTYVGFGMGSWEASGPGTWVMEFDDIFYTE